MEIRRKEGLNYEVVVKVAERIDFFTTRPTFETGYFRWKLFYSVSEWGD